MLDVLVPEIGLQRSGVMAVIGELITAGMPQHVRMRLKGELGLDPLSFPKIPSDPDSHRKTES